MTVTLDLPADTQSRLAAEAARRGLTVDQLVVELVASLADVDETVPKRRLSFIGVGNSGRDDLARRHREIRAEQLRGQRARDF